MAGATPVGVVRDAQSRPCAIFPAARAYSRCHSAFLEVLFSSQSKRASWSDGPFLAARVFRSLGSRSILSSKNHAVHSGQSQKSRAAQLALGRSPLLAHFVPLASGRRLSLSFMSQRHFVPPASSRLFVFTAADQFRRDVRIEQKTAHGT